MAKVNVRDAAGSTGSDQAPFGAPGSMRPAFALVHDPAPGPGMPDPAARGTGSKAEQRAGGPGGRGTASGIALAVDVRGGTADIARRGK